MSRIRVSATRAALSTYLLVAAFAAPVAAEGAVGSHTLAGALVKINGIEARPKAALPASSAKHSDIVIKGEKIAVDGEGVLADMPAPPPPGRDNITAKLRPGQGVAKDEKITISGGRTESAISAKPRAKFKPFDYPGDYAQRFDGANKDDSTPLGRSVHLHTYWGTPPAAPVRGGRLSRK